MPAETTTSSWPDATEAAAFRLVCIDEPHCRSTVVPLTSTGQPAARTVIRPMFHPCSPIWVTHPIWTSSTAPGSRPVRATSPFSTCAARSSPRIAASVPLRRPIGERTASTMYASITSTVVGLPRLLVVCQVDAPWPQVVDAEDRRGRTVDQLAHRVGDVAAEHGRPVAGRDHDGLMSHRVAGRREHRNAV